MIPTVYKRTLRMLIIAAIEDNERTVNYMGFSTPFKAFIHKLQRSLPGRNRLGKQHEFYTFIDGQSLTNSAKKSC